ncbi:probable 39S ribosomal protein L24, mitochondrial [Cephus cinctus]|uniref:Large ribosomal subunit protein uL24m n=1 Tax=Cephus cinctus TaxID=211228 RepID=A0AAJ7FQT3_CEPCN|nr:probable 39S ribosomal protein L24, mitochondrial [Cephus cinctus]XP_015603679.1 probable 39S ribosomal protein L24, mitochondrial [Cephus cinctus]
MRLTEYLMVRISKMTIQDSNLPGRYIKRTMEQVYVRTPRGKPQFLPRTIEKKNFRFTTNRPWTMPFYFQNLPNLNRKPVLVEPIKDWSIFRGDRVEILVGRDKGKQGIVTQIIRERNWVFVDGLNTHLRRMGKTKDFPGVVVQSEAPLLVTTQVSLIDPADLQATKIEWRYTEEGEKVRVSCRTGRIIPIPVSSTETVNYKSPKLYKEGAKDTPKEDVQKKTFKATLSTFEMDIMKKMGITDNRIPKPLYWY